MSKRNFTNYHEITKGSSELLLKKLFRPGFILLCMLVAVSASFAQLAPANDDPCNAVPLSVDAACTSPYPVFSNTDATATAGVADPLCSSYAGADVWFQVIVPAGGTINIDTEAGDILDGAMAIYTGTCDNLTEIDCNDDSPNGGLMPFISATGLTPGSTVWIRIFSFGASESGTFGICVSEPPPPPPAPVNDDPCNAIALTVDSTCNYNTFTNEGATATAGVADPSCSTTFSYQGGDVWFSVVVPAGGSLLFDSQTGVITDGMMALYTGTCDNLTEIACNDDGSPNGLMPLINATGLTPGSTVWVRFWEYGGDNNGTFGLCVTLPPPPPPNDDPCTAIPVTVDSVCNYTTYTNAGGTPSLGVPAPGCAFYQGGDVWFTAIVPAGGALLFDTQTGVVTDGGMAIYTAFNGTCDSLVLVACDDNSSNNGLMPSITAGGLIPGSTVWVRFWEFGNDNNGTFGLCISIPPPPPPNDEPCNAIPLTVDSVCHYTTFTNADATGSAGVPAPGCANYLGADVWFTATVPPGGALIFDTQTGVMNDGGMALYTGTCTALTLVACDDNSSSNGLMPKISSGGLVPGSTVWIRVWSWNNDNNGTFGICVTIPPPPPPNDDPCNAITLTTDSTCNYTTFTNVSALGTAGVPAPGCANYQGGDVWFQVTVPPGGALTFDTQEGTITDGGMAIYSGPSCNALTLIACDDNSNPNGLMPKISAGGLIPGSTVWIRFWDWGNFNSGTFGICVTIPPPPPVNDDPCNAITLTADSTCNYTTFTNASALGTVGVPAPGCAFYQGGDVWFKVTVPPGGALTFDTQTGVVTDGGMAIYSGTSCDALTLISCDDNTSANGLMPKILARGLVPGSTVWVRFWEFGNDNQGTFGICVTIPPPPPANDDPCNAVNLTVSNTCNYTTFSNVSSTPSANAPFPSCGNYNGGDVWFTVTVPAGGGMVIDTRSGNIGDAAMAVYSGTSCTALTELACDNNSSSNALMPYIYISGQTPGSTLWVRVWGLDTVSNTGTFDICVTVPLPEPSTFSFTCAKDTFLTCGVSPCFSLSSIIPNIHGSTSNYDVNPLSGAPGGCFKPYVSPGGPGTSTDLPIDDRYSGLITIPFTFPFYGINYTTLTASTNGYISFDPTNANGFANYSILNNGGFLSATAGTPQNLPSPLYGRAMIMGAFHDLDPAYNTSPTEKIKYNVTGTAPNRRWILSFYKVPLFNTNGRCDTLINNTQQIVLYEGTGVVEVFIFDRQACPTWNNARAMIGMQNFNQDAGIMAPGRAASDSGWGGIGLNESWRFVPSQGPTLFRKVELYDTAGNFIALGDTSSISNTNLRANFRNVCPTSNANVIKYIVKSTYTKFDDPNAIVVGTDTITVHRGVVEANFIVAKTKCKGSTDGTITINPITGTAPYTYVITGGNAVQNGNSFTVGAGTYTVSVTDSVGCGKDTVIVVTEPTPVMGTYQTTNVKCNGGNDGTITVTANGGTSPYLYAVGGGTYQVGNLFTVIAGSPVVSIKDANGCLKDTSLVITQPAILRDSAVTVNASCSPTPNGLITVSAFGGTAPYTYSTGSGFQPGNLFTVATGNYIITVKDSNSCVATIPAIVGFTFDLVLQGRQDTTVCDNSPVRLVTQSNALNYSWLPTTYLDNPSAASPLASATTSITYTLTASTGTCVLKDTVNIAIAPNPVVNAGPDVSVVKGEDGGLFASVTNSVSFIWSPTTYLNNPNVLNPLSVRPEQSTLYILTATNSVGCTASDSVLVTVVPYCIKVKNAFTPNGDGVNDTWQVYDQSECLTNIKVSVYNRYGSKVFESQNYRNEWRGTYNGKSLPEATYYYVLDFVLINGRKVQLRGDVTILR